LIPILENTTPVLIDASFNKDLKSKGINLYSIPDASLTFITSYIFSELKQKSSFLIYPTNLEAEAAYREILSYQDSNFVYYLPGNESIPYEYAHIPPDTKRDRIYTLSQIFKDDNILIVCSVAGFLQKVPGKQSIISESIEFLIKEEYIQEEILQKLIQLGYERRQICDHYGTFSVKGGIVDIFPSHLNYPIRLDFFGEELEEIKSYDPDSQRSISNFDKITIFPVDEFALNAKEKKEYYELLDEESNLNKPEERVLIVEELIPLIRDSYGILDYFDAQKPILIFSSIQAIKDKIVTIIS
jgi:transcription-repair coupling factor (superfamily II helicase)